jgi:hypothetical protein
LRDVHWNPQRHLANGALANPETRKLASEKETWIARQPTDPRGRRERFRVLQALTEQLRPSLASREHWLRDELAAYNDQLRANTLLRHRDYAFCLFPESTLRPFCTQFLFAAGSEGGSRPVASPMGTA